MVVMIHKQHLGSSNKINNLTCLRRILVPTIPITILFVVLFFTTNNKSIVNETTLVVTMPSENGSCWKYNNTNNDQIVVQYKLVQEGTIPGGKASFRKFVAVYSIKTNADSQNDSNINTVNAQQLTVREWVDCILHDTIDNNNNSNHAIRGMYTVLKDNIPYDGYFFETPPISYTSFHDNTQLFEFVIVDSPRLHQVATKNPSYDTFQSNCEQQHPNDSNANNNSSNDYCCVFPNLSGDAVLVVPKPQPQKQLDPTKTTGTTSIVVNVATNNYSHLASFVQNAPYEQFTTVWKTIAHTYTNIIMGTSSSSSSSSTFSNEKDGTNKSVVDKNKKIWFSTSGLGVYWLHFRFDNYPKYYTYQPYKIM